MALDTTTPSLGLLLQGTGNNNNSWGENLNKFVFEYLEHAVAGLTFIAVDGGTDNLTADQARYGTIHFEGELSAKQVIVVDNVPKRWTIGNFTTGNFVLHMKTAAGDPIEIPQGTVKQIYCDGEDSLIRMDQDQVGTIIAHAGSTPRPGTLLCSGGTYVRADRPDLFKAIGETWGPGNGATTAGLPNLTDTNRFLRAAGGDVPVGTYQANQNKQHSHTAAATTTVTGTATYAGAHSHTFSGYTSTGGGHTHSLGNASGNNDASGVGPTPQGGASYSTNYAGDHFHSYSGSTSGLTDHTHILTLTASTTVTIDEEGGSEARPESAAVLMCIVI